MTWKVVAERGDLELKEVYPRKYVVMIKDSLYRKSLSTPTQAPFYMTKDHGQTFEEQNVTPKQAETILVWKQHFEKEMA